MVKYFLSLSLEKIKAMNSLCLQKQYHQMDQKTHGAEYKGGEMGVVVKRKFGFTYEVLIGYN